MMSKQTKLYSLAAPFALLLPVMDFHFSDIPGWFQGNDFLTLFAEILIQMFTGIADALIAIFVDSAFGVLGT